MTNQTLTSADLVLSQIEKLSEKHFLPIVGASKGQILSKQVRKAKPHHILEAGTLIGYSAILMGRELDENAQIATIEIHQDEAKLAEKNIQRANIPPKITIITGDAKTIIPTLKGSFDFVFIDAEKNEYFQYLKLAEPKLQKGTVIVADNAGIFAEQMKDYLDYMRNSGKYQSRYVKVGGDGLEISFKL
jgi:predicted O-methyltransferase YrrM